VLLADANAIIRHAGTTETAIQARASSNQSADRSSNLISQASRRLQDSREILDRFKHAVTLILRDCFMIRCSNSLNLDQVCAL